MQIFLRWIVGAIALFITVKLAEIFHIGLALRGGSEGIVSAFLVILALTLVNAFIRPILSLLTMPLNCLTLGLFSLVINALMFWLVGSLDLGLKVSSFWAALFGSLALSFISGVLNQFVAKRED